MQTNAITLPQLLNSLQQTQNSCLCLKKTSNSCNNLTVVSNTLTVVSNKALTSYINIALSYLGFGVLAGVNTNPQDIEDYIYTVVKPNPIGENPCCTLRKLAEKTQDVAVKEHIIQGLKRYDWWARYEWWDHSDNNNKLPNWCKYTSLCNAWEILEEAVLRKVELKQARGLKVAPYSEDPTESLSFKFKCYLDGDRELDSNKRFEYAIEYYKEESSKGSATADYMLALIYTYTPSYVEARYSWRRCSDYREASALKEKALDQLCKAAKHDIPAAKYLLGKVMLDEKIVARAGFNAVELITCAAHEGISEARLSFGKILEEQGKYEESLGWLLLAADHDLGEAYYYLSNQYLNELGGNPSLGWQYLQKAVNSNQLDNDQDVDAHLSLAMAYAVGNGYVQKNLEKARNYLDFVQVYGRSTFNASFYDLGKIFYKEKDLDTAIHYMEIAANESIQDSEQLLKLYKDEKNQCNKML